jgi:hypothetical protein
LGWTEAPCEVWHLSEADTQLALATLNRLRGQDHVTKRAELLDGLTEHFSIVDLSELIPESTQEIEDLLASLNVDFQELEQQFHKQIETEAESLPVALSFLVSTSDAEVIEQALLQAKQNDRGQALVRICQSFLGKNAHA